MNNTGIVHKIDGFIGSCWNTYWSGFDTGWNIWFRTVSPLVVLWIYVVFICNVVFNYASGCIPGFFIGISTKWIIINSIILLPVTLIVSAILYGGIVGFLTYWGMILIKKFTEAMFK